MENLILLSFTSVSNYFFTNVCKYLINVCIHMYICVYISVYICVYKCVYMTIYQSIYGYMCVCVEIYIVTGIYKFAQEIYIYIYIYIHIFFNNVKPKYSY